MAATTAQDAHCDGVDLPWQRILATGDDFEYPARAGLPPNPALPPLAAISPSRLSPTALGTDQQAAELIQEAGLA